jgi:thiosulfate reductase cytochrome b subunit
MAKERVKKYKRFERFWHWFQAALIFFLALTGFEVHDSIHIFGYEKAVEFHRIASYMFLVLIVFAIFWHLTTEEWRQYIPTFTNIKEQIRYYMVGIFKNEPHPTQKDKWQKLNPLQILTYLGFKILIIPVMVGSGLLYMFHKTINVNNVVVISDFNLETIAVWHTFGAYILIAFIIVHAYMTTTGDSPTSNLKAMLTGYEDHHGDEQKEDKKPIDKTKTEGDQ